MPNVLNIPPTLIWPFALALAWVIGEIGYRLMRIPRLTSYGIVGFLMAAGQLGLLSPSGSTTITLLANISFSLILFELGYRINLYWLKANKWLGVTSLVEAGLTFLAVYAVSVWFGLGTLPALLLASLAMSTSPAVVLRVVNEQKSSGQVTERSLHLTAFNCVLSLFVFKVVLGFWVFEHTGHLGQALLTSLVVLLASAAAGAVFGVAVPGLLRKLAVRGPDATVAFAISVILLVAVMHLLEFSPALAALTFGLTVRHRRIALDQAQRNFGALGNLLVVLLFVYVATTIEASKVISGAGLALAIIATRFLTKTLSVTAFARLSGISHQKGLWTGVALMPLSVFALVMLDQPASIGLDLVEGLSALAAMALILEIFGPILVQRALIWAKEVPSNKED